MTRNSWVALGEYYLYTVRELEAEIELTTNPHRYSLTADSFKLIINEVDLVLPFFLLKILYLIHILLTNNVL